MNHISYRQYVRHLRRTVQDPRTVTRSFAREMWNKWKEVLDRLQMTAIKL